MPQSAATALEQKRRNIKAVKDAYDSMAKGTLTLFEPGRFRELRESQAAAIAAGNEHSLPTAIEKPAASESDFKALVAAKINIEPNIRERSKLVFLTPRDRYESLRIAINKNQRVSAADLSFMADYESKMTDAEEAYFSSQSRLMK